ncbi:MAG: hypothetical protein V8R81_09680 [Clostridia bacterium]
MNVKGEELNGVFGGNELLEFNTHPDYSGKTVIVVAVEMLLWTVQEL